MFSLKFIKDALERAVATAAQAYLATGFVISGGYFSADAAKIAGGAAFLSLLKAVVATRVGDKESAGLV